jgi:hypothetical protein
MAVYLIRNYGGYTASSTVPVTFPDSTEASLIAQGIASAAQTTSWASTVGGPDGFVTQGGNTNDANQAGYTTPTNPAGNSILTTIALGSLALTSYETNGVTQTAGQWNFGEITVPYFNTWKGAGVLNGTTVGTSKYIVALWGTNGTLLANSAVAGALSVGGSVMQNFNFLNPINLVPGRYFLGLQMDVATDTVRHVLSANGSFLMCGTQSGTFGTVPNITTVPTTFTTAVAPIMQLVTF